MGEALRSGAGAVVPREWRPQGTLLSGHAVSSTWCSAGSFDLAGHAQNCRMRRGIWCGRMRLGKDACGLRVVRLAAVPALPLHPVLVMVRLGCCVVLYGGAAGVWSWWPGDGVFELRWPSVRVVGDELLRGYAPQ